MSNGAIKRMRQPSTDGDSDSHLQTPVLKGTHIESIPESLERNNDRNRANQTVQGSRNWIQGAYSTILLMAKRLTPV